MLSSNWSIATPESVEAKKSGGAAADKSELKAAVEEGFRNGRSDRCGGVKEGIENFWAWYKTSVLEKSEV